MIQSTHTKKKPRHTRKKKMKTKLVNNTKIYTNNFQGLLQSFYLPKPWEEKKNLSHFLENHMDGSQG